MTRKKAVIAPQTTVLAPLTTNELIENIIGGVKTARHLGVEPQFAVTVVERDGEYCGAVMVMYAAEASIDRDGKPYVGLTPQFYPAEVATELQTRGLLIESGTSRRTGINTTWCYFSDTYI